MADACCDDSWGGLRYADDLMLHSIEMEAKVAQMTWEANIASRALLDAHHFSVGLQQLLRIPYRPLPLARVGVGFRGTVEIAELADDGAVKTSRPSLSNGEAP